MIRGRMVGTVWAARKSEALAGNKLALVAELCQGKPTGRLVVAIDLLDAEPGREVVVSFGSGARIAVAMHAGYETLADAAVTQVIEGGSCSWDA